MLKEKKEMKRDLQNKSLIDGYYERFDRIARLFFDNKANSEKAVKCMEILQSTKERGSMIYLIGNGGSSAVAEHTAVDLTKNAGLKALAVSGSPMLTTLSNDYGYKNVFKKFLELFASRGDVLIAVSSSGSSENIINACKEARKKGMDIIALSGFEQDNPLRELADVEFWIPSRAFGYLEILHGLILHWIVDSIIGSEIYMIR